MDYYQINISKENELLTEGLKKFGYPEICLKLHEGDVVRMGEDILRTIGDYMMNKNIRIKSGETVAYGSWTLQLKDNGIEILKVFEYDPSISDFKEGASWAMKLHNTQEKICLEQSAAFLPPQVDQKIIISDGVMKGEKVQGIRYPSPDYMSGWWLTTSSYTGDEKTLKIEHLMHVLEKCPDIAQFFALPYGYGFNEDGSVFFDKKVADSVN